MSWEIKVELCLKLENSEMPEETGSQQAIEVGTIWTKPGGNGSTFYFRVSDVIGEFAYGVQALMTGPDRTKTLTLTSSVSNSVDDIIGNWTQSSLGSMTQAIQQYASINFNLEL